MFAKTKQDTNIYFDSNRAYHIKKIIQEKFGQAERKHIVVQRSDSILEFIFQGHEGSKKAKIYEAKDFMITHIIYTGE